jgi:hypothetical protein
MPPPLEMPVHLVLLLCVINSLEVEEVAVSPFQHTNLPGPSFLHACFVCCLLSFLHLPSSSVRILGQACMAPEQGPESEVTPVWETNYQGNLKPEMSRQSWRRLCIRNK